MDIKAVGKKLHDARKEQDKDIKSIAKKLKIRENYLREIEAGNEVEGIYMAGYIKSYAQTLGLNYKNLVDSIEAKSDENSENDGSNDSKEPRNTSKPKKSISSMSNVFYVEKRSSKPGVAVIAASVFVLSVSYYVWYNINNQNRENAVDVVDSVIIEIQEDVVNNDNNKVSDNSSELWEKDLVFLAKDKLVLKINNESDNTIINHEMEIGEVYFVPKSDKVTISADKPQFVEVFIDDENNTFVGRLDSLMKN